MKTLKSFVLTTALTFAGAGGAYASEADLKIPKLDSVTFSSLGGVSGHTLMLIGLAVCILGGLFGLLQYQQTKNLPVHDSMATVSNTIWETCKTYLFTQGKFLAILLSLIHISEPTRPY